MQKFMTWMLAAFVLAAPLRTQAGVEAERPSLARTPVAWVPVDDAVLDELRGGLRARRLRFSIAFRARHRVNGRTVFGSVLRSGHRGERSFEPQSSTVAPPEIEGIELTHALTREGARLVVSNAADGVRIQSEADLEITVHNFTQALGTPRFRAARSVARGIGRGMAR